MGGRSHEALAKPFVDNFNYRFLDLSNGLRALVIQDPEADKAACSCDVGIGSLLDPDDFLGLAHFLEHMLFYSSAKYPVEDEYSKFITEGGGHTNAYTSAEDTNFQFDINWEHLEPALDRFAQFFIAPLISADGVDREINAVDSENGKNLQLDMWRQLQLSKHTANRAHPWSKFNTGSLETLKTAPLAKGLNIHQAVIDFHARHYSANNMRVVVLSRHSLDELEAMVRSKFEPIANKGLPKPQFASDVYLPEHRAQLLKVVPVKEGHTIDFFWQVPPSTPVYRKAPLNYLSHLLGHEGEGSVFALLKARGLASSLVAGESGASIESASFFYVRVELTEEGKEHIPEIGDVIFRYLAMVSREGIQRFIHDEMAALQRLRFDYRDKMAPFAYTTALSSAMQTYPDEDLLLALYHVPMEFDPDAIKAVLQEMTVDKVRIMWASKVHASEATETEPWYGTKYSIQPIPKEWFQVWQEASQSLPTVTEQQSEGPRLHLPAPNPFIPTDLSLKTEEAKAYAAEGVVGPKLIDHQPGVLSLWHRCDLTFPTPKALVMVDFQSPEAYASPEAAVCARLFVKLVADALNELAYPAELASLVYGVSNSQAGFQVVVSGYNHKLPVLLEAVLKQLGGLQVKPDRFSLMVEKLKKDYSNIKYSQPYSWAMYKRELLQNMKRWSVDEYAEVIDDITPQVLEAFIARIFSRCYVEMMAAGNVAETEARGMAGLVTNMLKGVGAKHVLPSQMKDMRCIRMPAGETTLLHEPVPNPENKNSAVSIIYQVGPDNLRTNALLQLFVHMSKRDAFNVLRTQQQLGYVVAMFNNHELGIHHLEFVIQSTSHPVSQLCARVENFLQRLCKELLPPRCGLPPTSSKSQSCEANGTLSDGEFRKAVEELVKSKLEKPKRLGELATRWWNEISFSTLEFARQEREAEMLRTLTPSDLLAFAETVLLQPSTRRKAVIAAHAHDGPAAEPEGSTAVQASAAVGGGEGHPVSVVGCISQFKRGCEVWPTVHGFYSLQRQRQQQQQ